MYTGDNLDDEEERLNRLTVREDHSMISVDDLPTSNAAGGNNNNSNSNSNHTGEANTAGIAKKGECVQLFSSMIIVLRIDGTSQVSILDVFASQSLHHRRMLPLLQVVPAKRNQVCTCNILIYIIKGCVLIAMYVVIRRCTSWCA